MIILNKKALITLISAKHPARHVTLKKSGKIRRIEREVWRKLNRKRKLGKQIKLAPPKEINDFDTNVSQDYAELGRIVSIKTDIPFEELPF